MAQYTIQTSKGPQGPFSVEQLQKFVDQGKIPAEFKVTDAETGEKIPVNQVLPEPEIDLDGLLDDFVIPAAPTPPPIPSRPAMEPDPGPPTGPAPRRAPVRGGRRTASAAPRGGRATSRRTGGRGYSGATPQFKTRRPKTLLVVVLVLGGLGLYSYLHHLRTGDTGIEGTWVCNLGKALDMSTGDVAGFERGFAKSAVEAGIEIGSPEYEMQLAAAKELMKGISKFRLIFSPDRVVFSALGSDGEWIVLNEGVPQLRPDGAGRYDVTVTHVDGTASEWLFRVSGRRLIWAIAGSQIVFYRS